MNPFAHFTRYVPLSGWLLLWLGTANVVAQPGLAFETYGLLGGLTNTKTTYATAPMRGVDLTLSRQTRGRAAWQSMHCFPQMGVTLRGRDIGNRTLYGYDLALIPFLEFNVWQNRWLVFQLKHGTGVGYVSRRYDARTNPGNTLISTALNAVSLLNAGLLMHGSRQLSLKLGAELSHASNGNLRQPNAGLNTMNLYAGLRYFPHGRIITPALPDHRSRRRRDWRGYVGAAVGAYAADERGALRLVPQLETALLFQHDVRFRASGGLELIFPNGTNGPQLGLKLGEEVLFGHIGICYQLGTYLYKPTGSGPVFEKVGMAWYPFPLVGQTARKLCVGTLLKAHGIRAAFIELNAGYVF